MTFPDPAPVAIDGVRFAVRRAGPAAPSGRPPVLLLHGVPQTSSVWRDLMPVLAEDRVVIAPDLKGLGGSEHRPPYDRPTLARELAALVLHVLDEMGAAGDGTRIDVVGHDFGGVLALALAAERPDLVRRLVIAAAPYRKVDLLKAFHVPLLALPVVPELVLRRLSFARAAYARAWKAATPPPRSQVDADAAAYAGDDRIAGMLAYYRAAAKAARTPAPDVVVERALVIWGAEDPALPISVGEAVVKDLGRAGTDPANVRMIVANGAGHFVLEEAAGVVLPAIVAFLRDGDDTPAAATAVPAAERATGPVAPADAPAPVPPPAAAPEPKAEEEPEADAAPAPVAPPPVKATPADIPPKKGTRTRTRTNQSAAKRVAAKKATTPPAAGATPAARAVQKAAAKSTAKKATPRVAPAGTGKDADRVDTPLEADPADVAEQQRDAVPPSIDRDDEAAVVSTDANRVVDVTDEEGADQLPLDEG